MISLVTITKTFDTPKRTNKTTQSEVLRPTYIVWRPESRPSHPQKFGHLIMLKPTEAQKQHWWLSDILSFWLSVILTFWLPDFLTFWLYDFLIFWYSDFLIFWLSDFLTFRLSDFPTFWISDFLLIRLILLILHFDYSIMLLLTFSLAIFRIFDGMQQCFTLSLSNSFSILRKVLLFYTAQKILLQD